MSSTKDIKILRRWMYERFHKITNQVSEENYQILKSFIQFTKNQELFLENGKLFCPYSKCENGKLLQEEIILKNLYN